MMNEPKATFPRRAEMLQKNLAEETIIYSPPMDAVHVFHQTARLIWDLYDKEHTVG